MPKTVLTAYLEVQISVELHFMLGPLSIILLEIKV